jgi:metalloendopeptidase OMA1, mitochondrial
MSPLRTIAICCLIAAVSVPIGCGPVMQGEGPGQRFQPLALTPQEELQLGREAYAEILSQAVVVREGPEVDRVRRVSQRIAKAVEIEPLQREINLHLSQYRFEWEYAVIAEEQINAFCLPGGKIAVFTGLLQVVQNDDQLAAVIAHEVAHALAHHTSERIARQQEFGRGLLSLAFDREQESEADHIGLFLMTFAGYDPQQAVVFWKEMEAIHQRGPHLPAILSNHPSDAHRERNMEQWVPVAKAAKIAYDEGRIAPKR